MQPEQRQPEQQPDTPVQTDVPEQQPVHPESPEKKSNAKRIIALILTLALLAIGGVAFYNASIGSRYLEPIPELPSFDPSLPKGKESLEASKAAWPGDGQGYWHAKIGDRPRKLYDAMLPHLAAREDAFEVGYLKDYIDGLEYMGQEDVNAASKSLGNDFGIALFAITEDHPEMFWINTSVFRKTFASKMQLAGNTADDTRLTLEGVDYGLTEEQVAQTQAKMDAVVQEALDSAPKDGSDYEQALAVYRWLANHVTYAEEVANLISNKASIEEVDEASSLYQGADSALVGGVSVCAGYSRAYQLLLGKLGIPCTVVDGLGDPLDPNLAHVWNLVCLGGRLGYTDTTWSDIEARLVHFEGGYPGGRYSREMLVDGHAEISYFFMTDADMEYDGRAAGRPEYEQAGLNIKELLPACDTIIWEDDRYEPGYREPEGKGHFRLLPKPAEQQD